MALSHYSSPKDQTGPLSPNLYLLPQCGIYQNNSKKERENSPEKSEKEREKETHVKSSLSPPPPLFFTGLKASKRSSFPR
jgi:hypothetical protein